MIAARNHRIYLVLDPDEASELQRILLQSSNTEFAKAFDEGRENQIPRKTNKIYWRLEQAIERAREKGAKFPKP